MEMVRLEGFSWGKNPGFAFDQSKYSVESFFVQNSLTSVSESSLGIGLGLFKIDSPFFSIHVPGGNNPNPVLAFRKGKKQRSPRVAYAKRIKSWFDFGMFHIRQHIKRIVEKSLFTFPPRHPVFLPILYTVGIVPIKTGEILEQFQKIVLSVYVKYIQSKMQKQAKIAEKMAEKLAVNMPLRSRG
jgi:hypothetical protein